MGIIVLKHLAREFDLDPFRLRQILRKEYGYAAGRRWRWDEKADAGELKSVREFLTGRRERKKASDGSSETPTSSPAKSSGKGTSRRRGKSTGEALSSVLDVGNPKSISVRSVAPKPSLEFTERLRGAVTTGDAFIANVSEQRKQLAAVKEGLQTGDDTTTRQKLSNAKKKMGAIAKSGVSPKPKK